MPDPGFISGFIGVGINISVHYILDQINNARCCEKELRSLRHLVEKIGPIVKDIQQYRLALNWKNGIRNQAPAVNEWLRKLDGLLRQASAMAQKCTIPSWDVISRYKTGKNIINLNSYISQHLEMVSLVGWASVLQGLGQTTEMIQSSASSSVSPSATASQPLIDSTGFFIKEPFIVGQYSALSRLQKLVIDEAADFPFSRIGVFGKGGSGKTLLLKRLFNCKEVRDFLCDGLFLWLTVSQSPSFTSLLNELSAQIAAYSKVDLDKNMSQEAVQIWLNETLQQSSRFALFIDDVWEKDAAELLEELGILRAVTDHSNSKVIVSSRYRSVLLKMGVADKYTITMDNLCKDESWKLFAYHAFPYNNRSIPANIDEENAKLVCHKCGGLPLAVKVVGRAMAGCTDPTEWKWASQRLPNDHSLDACLRLSYNALGKEDIRLQLCFLYVAAAFVEDQIIHTNHLIPLLLGEGLLARKDGHQLSYNSFAMGRVYLNLLADRCLIEPIVRSIQGSVVFFKIHDILRDLGIRIAEAEENFHCRVGQGLSTFNENECSGRTRILLSNNELCSLPQSMRVPELCSLSMDGNKCLAKIPKRVIGSMVSLKFLDLSGTSVQSLPESVGHLKQLTCLLLSSMPIKLLPASLTNLGNLEILDLSRSSITKLPSGLHNLKSLRHLAMDKCVHLRYLPYSISRLTSLRCLSMYGCTSLWEKSERKRWKKVATINNLASLKQLARLHLTNNGGVIREGTLGNMIEMNTLMLQLTKMKSLPSDMYNMSELSRLYMECPDLVKMESNFCDFQRMTSLILYKCGMLEELPHLHKLNSIERLEIIECSRLKKVPQEFGDREAFSSLEIFSIVGLQGLEELPMVKEGAMPLLKTFVIVECSALKIFPMSYFNLKTLKIIKIYGCSSMIMENSREIQESNTMIEVKTMSIEDTRDSRKGYSEVREGMKSWLYGEFWNNELFLFLRSLYTLA